MPDLPPQPQPDRSQSTDCSPVCDALRPASLLARKKRKSRGWHRTLGLLTALPLLWVLLTGAALNHSATFALDTTLVTNQFVLAAYGMTPQGEPRITVIHSSNIVAWDGLVFINNSPLELSGDFLGAVADGDGYLIVSSDSAQRLDASGALIEVLDELTLPSLPLEAVGFENSTVFLRNAEGWFVPGEEWMSFTASDVVPAEVADAVVLSDVTLKKEIAALWSGGGLPLSRVILDLHAGKFLGSLAKYFYDVVTLCALWLIGTGIVLQIRVAARNRKK